MTSLTKRTLTSVPEAFFGGLTWALRMLSVWNGRARQRQALRHLDTHILRDIGIDRNSALDEAERPFWKG